MIGLALHSTAAAAAALTRSLDELASLLEQTTDSTYLWKPDGGVSGTIGAHVRHVLDHVRVLVDRPSTGRVTYDDRRRDTLIEHCRQAGIGALRLSVRRLQTVLDGPDEMLVLEAQVERGGAPIAVTTSLGRELVFALQHTIHHQAIIAVLLHEIGVETPAQFGYAPATPAH